MGETQSKSLALAICSRSEHRRHSTEVLVAVRPSPIAATTAAHATPIRYCWDAHRLKEPVLCEKQSNKRMSDSPLERVHHVDCSLRTLYAAGWMMVGSIPLPITDSMADLALNSACFLVLYSCM